MEAALTVASDDGSVLLRVRDDLIVQDTAVQAPDGSARMGEPSSKACKGYPSRWVGQPLQLIREDF
jgi:hypothetical protein